MTDMDQMTQDNASITQQTNAAAFKLNKQTIKLKKIIAELIRMIKGTTADDERNTLEEQRMLAVTMRIARAGATSADDRVEQPRSFHLPDVHATRPAKGYFGLWGHMRSNHGCFSCAAVNF